MLQFEVRVRSCLLTSNPSLGLCPSFCPHLLVFPSQEGTGEEPMAAAWHFLIISFLYLQWMFSYFKIHFSCLQFESKNSIWFKEPNNFYKTAATRYWGLDQCPRYIPSLNNLCISYNILKWFQIYAPWFHVNFYWSFGILHNKCWRDFYRNL